jgi:hypothetical protein
MTEPRNSEHHTKVHQEKTYHGVGATAGRAAYREEYLRDHGPDLDEWLDGTESGQEI